MQGNSHKLIFERDGDDWKIEGAKAKHHRMSFPKGSGRHDIAFAIDTPDGRYQFDANDPIWAQEGTACPPPGAHHPHLQVKSVDGDQLVVHNTNEDEATLCYQLNVVDTKTARPVPIDPVINNGGHG